MHANFRADARSRACTRPGIAAVALPRRLTLQSMRAAALVLNYNYYYVVGKVFWTRGSLAGTPAPSDSHARRYKPADRRRALVDDDDDAIATSVDNETDAVVACLPSS